MSSANAAKVSTCVNNPTLSAKLVAEMEAKTTGIREVPTLHVEGQDWNGNWEHIQTLVNDLCNDYTGSNKPAACSNEKLNPRTCKLPF